MTQNTPHIHQGNLLIASPLLKDPNFARSVVLILDRDSDRGFIGLILNHKLELSLQEICQIEKRGDDVPVFNGGPVDLQRLFWLHTLGDKIKDSKEVLPGIYVGGNYDDILAHIYDENIENKIRFYLGYSGWVAGQLEKEVEGGAWKVNSLTDPTEILKGEGETFWRDQVKQLGPSVKHWLLLPSDPSLN